MSRIKMKMDSEASRMFWETFPRSQNETDKKVILPSLGDLWWEAEKELSPTLLSVKTSKACGGDGKCAG